MPGIENYNALIVHFGDIKLQQMYVCCIVNALPMIWIKWHYEIMNTRYSHCMHYVTEHIYWFLKLISTNLSNCRLSLRWCSSGRGGFGLVSPGGVVLHFLAHGLLIVRDDRHHPTGQREEPWAWGDPGGPGLHGKLEVGSTNWCSVISFLFSHACVCVMCL